MDGEAWERQPGESQVAFAAFAVYRAQPVPRSLSTLAELSGRSVSLLKRWSARHHWQARTSAWDRHIQATIDAQTTLAVTEMTKRHAALARAMSAKVAQRLQRLDPGELTPATVAQWFDALVRVERLALGLSTDRVERQGAPDVAVTVDVEPAQPFVPVDSLLDRLALAGLIPAPPGIDPASD